MPLSTCTHCGGPLRPAAQPGRYSTCMACMASDKEPLTLPLLREIIHHRQIDRLDLEGVDYMGEHTVTELLSLARHVHALTGVEVHRQVAQMAPALFLEGPPEPPASLDYLWHGLEAIYILLRGTVLASTTGKDTR